MSGEDSANRRRFLQAVGVGALSTGPAINVVGATDDESSTPSVVVGKKRLLQAEEVQSVLSAIGNPSYRAEEAQASAITFDSGAAFKMLEVPTDFGTLFVGSHGDSYTEATILLNDRARRMFVSPNSNAGSKLSIQWPGNTDALVSDTGDGPLFVREASTAERKRLAEITGKSADKIVAFRNSERDAFLVTDPDETTGRQSDTPSTTADAKQMWVDLDAGEVTGNRTVDQSSQVSARLSKEGCLVSFGTCAADLAFPSACKHCGLACKSSKLTGWVGYAACFICISHMCGGEAFKYFTDCKDVIPCIDKYIIDVPFV